MTVGIYVGQLPLPGVLTMTTISLRLAFTIKSRPVYNSHVSMKAAAGRPKESHLPQAGIENKRSEGIINELGSFIINEMVDFRGANML